MSDMYVARKGHRYSKIAPGSLYESQVTSLVEKNLSAIFPHHIGAQLEPFIKTAAGNVKPDIVLVRKDFNGWALVEVEVDTHSFGSHILPQLTKLRYAVSDSNLVNALHSELKKRKQVVEDDFTKLLSALEKPPSVYLLIHGSSHDVEHHLETLKVEAIDLEVHLSATQANEYLLVANDRTRTLKSLDIRVDRSPNPLTKRFWVTSGNLPDEVSPKGEQILVSLDGEVAIWSLTRTENGAFLRQPSELSVPDNIVSASVFYDAESGVIHLIY